MLHSHEEKYIREHYRVRHTQSMHMCTNCTRKIQRKVECLGQSENFEVFLPASDPPISLRTSNLLWLPAVLPSMHAPERHSITWKALPQESAFSNKITDVRYGKGPRPIQMTDQLLAQFRNLSNSEKSAFVDQFLQHLGPDQKWQLQQRLPQFLFRDFFTLLPDEVLEVRWLFL